MALQYNLSGVNLSNQTPVFNADQTKLIFTMQVVTNITGAQVGKFEQVDTTTFEMDVVGFNPLAVKAATEAAALTFIANTYG